MTDFSTSIFYFSKYRIILFIFILLSLMAAMVFLGFLAIDIMPKLIIVLILLILTLGLYAIVRLIYFLRRCLKNIPALVLTQDKLIDDMIGIAFKWTDFESFSRETIKLSNVIRINLKERNQYLAQIKNPIIRKLATIQLFDLFVIQTNIIVGDRNKIYESLVHAHRLAAG